MDKVPQIQDLLVGGCLWILSSPKKRCPPSPSPSKEFPLQKMLDKILGFMEWLMFLLPFFTLPTWKGLPIKNPSRSTPQQNPNNPAHLRSSCLFPAKDLILASDITRQSTGAAASSLIWAQHLLQGPLDPQLIFGKREQKMELTVNTFFWWKSYAIWNSYIWNMIFWNSYIH